MRITIITILLICFGKLSAQEHFSGLFMKDSTDYFYSDALVQKDFNALDDSLTRQGYILTDWNLSDGKELIFRGIWNKNRSSPAVTPIIEKTSWEAFIKEKRAKVKEGSLMINVQYYSDLVGSAHYLAKWKKDSTIHKVWKFSSFDYLKKKVQAMKKDGFVLKEVEVNPDENRDPVFLALFYKKEFLKSFSYCYQAKGLAAFNDAILRRRKSGYFLSDIETYHQKGSDYYVGIFEKGKQPFTFVGNLSEDAFLQKWEELEKEGYILIDLE